MISPRYVRLSLRWFLIALNEILGGSNKFCLASTLIQDDGAAVETAVVAFSILILLFLDGDEFGLDLFFLFDEGLILLTVLHV